LRISPHFFCGNGVEFGKKRYLCAIICVNNFSNYQILIF
jgi:hypothetical protein